MLDNSVEGRTKLLRRFAPQVRFHPDEAFFPISVDDYLSYVTLKRADNVPDKPRPSFQDLAACRLFGDAAHLEYHPRQQSSAGQDPRTSSIPPRCYAHILLTRDWLGAEYVDLQYWFFYAFNGALSLPISVIPLLTPAFSGGEHFGDWEHVTVRINAQQQMVAVYCSAHSDEAQWHKSGEFQTVGDQSDGVHPVIYAAYHSHANYIDAKTQSRKGLAPDDRTADGGAQWNCWGNVMEIDWATQTPTLNGQDWVLFMGKWGQTEGHWPENASSPTGPAAKSDFGIAHPNSLLIVNEGRGNSGTLCYTTIDGSFATPQQTVPKRTARGLIGMTIYNGAPQAVYEGEAQTARWSTFSGSYTFDLAGQLDATPWTKEQPLASQSLCCKGGTAVATLRDNMHAVCEWGDGWLYWSTYTGVQHSWSSATQLPNNAGTSGPPALAVFKDRLYCIHEGRGRNGWLYWCSLDGNGWTPDVQLPNKAGTSGPPGLAVYQDRLYCVHEGRGNNGRLYWCSFDGATWSDDLPLPNNATTKSPPGLAVYNSRLYCVHEAGDGWLFACSWDGTSWTADTQLVNGAGTSGQPTLIVGATWASSSATSLGGSSNPRQTATE
jgi:chitinase